MGAPKIKLYQLPDGYVETADTDIQSMVGDELVPVVNKLPLLSQVKAASPLTPVVYQDGEDLLCFDLAGGRVQRALVANPAKPGYWVCATGAWGDYLWQPIGVLSPVVKKADDTVIDPSKYVIDEGGVTFTSAEVGTKIEMYLRAAHGASTKYAMVGDAPYRGANPVWNRLLVSKNGGEYVEVPQPADRVGYIDTSGVTGLESPITSLKAVYCVEAVRWTFAGTWNKTPVAAKAFLAEQANWVGGHLRMWPDIFVGEYNYPGDDYEEVTFVNGTPVRTPKVVGPMPRFRDPGTYTVHFHWGMVEFPEAIDASLADNAPGVKANYAYVVGVKSVTGLKLSPVGGSGNLRWAVPNSGVWADAFGKRWVGRSDRYMPLNVYVDGKLAPQNKQISNETMTVKLS